jgi:DNA-binding HxlR family transcriptional regulator
VLADRLGELGDAGLVVRRVEPGPPVAVTYHLSGSGEALVPTLHLLASWAAANLTTEATS